MNKIIDNNDVLKLKNLFVSYKVKEKNIDTIKNLSFSVKKGEFLSIIGESGSGKSTIAKAMIGLLPKKTQISGEFAIINYVLNLKTSDINWAEFRGKKIGFIFQDAYQSLNPMLKIKKHFDDVLLNAKKTNPEDIIKHYLKFLNFKNVDDILDSYPFQLSGGMCQRVCIALSLCSEPDIIIADEATSALDIISKIEVLKLLKKIKKDLNKTIIFITHDIQLAKIMSDRIMVLKEGKIKDFGSYTQILSKPSDYSEYLLNALKKIPTIAYEKQLINDNKILVINNLSKAFKKNEENFLKNIFLEIKEKEIVGILGESGCGKSTLAKCIVGLESYNSGEIIYKGKNLKSYKKDIKKSIQIIFQNARGSLNPRRKIIDLVMEPMNYQNIYEHKKRKEIAENLLKEVGISNDLFERRSPELSTGQCQRVAIARALAIEPELLICDEAVSSLDVSIQNQILNLLLNIYRKRGISLLMISHDIKVLKNFCHKIAVMNNGSFCEVIETNYLEKALKNSYTKKLLEIEKNYMSF